MKTSVIILAIAALGFAPQQTSTAGATTPGSLLGSNRVDGLTEEARIVIATNYILNIEPGVSANQSKDAVTLSTYDGSRIRVGFGSNKVAFASPIVARITPEGWDFGTGKVVPAGAIRVSRDEQDDTDSNLNSMQKSAKKLKEKNASNPNNQNQNGDQPNKKIHVRFLFGENPFPTAELFNQQAIQQLTHLSPIGF